MQAFGAWPSGKATGFGPVTLGSNPSAPATLIFKEVPKNPKMLRYSLMMANFII